MNLIDESDKYILRGIFYLIAWFLVMPFAFAAIGSVTMGLLGLILGLVLSTVLGVWGYDLYLRWNGRKLLREYNKR